MNSAQSLDGVPVFGSPARQSGWSPSFARSMSPVISDEHSVAVQSRSLWARCKQEPSEEGERLEAERGVASAVRSKALVSVNITVQLS